MNVQLRHQVIGKVMRSDHIEPGVEMRTNHNRQCRRVAKSQSRKVAKSQSHRVVQA